MKPTIVHWGKVKFVLGIDDKYREAAPKHPNPNQLVAPEHFHVAVLMSRIKGELQIEPNSIFAYSQNNPPAWLKGAVRQRLTTR